MYPLDKDVKSWAEEMENTPQPIRIIIRLHGINQNKPDLEVRQKAVSEIQYLAKFATVENITDLVSIVRVFREPGVEETEYRL